MSRVADPSRHHFAQGLHHGLLGVTVPHAQFAQNTAGSYTGAWDATRRSFLHLCSFEMRFEADGRRDTTSPSEHTVTRTTKRATAPGIAPDEVDGRLPDVPADEGRGMCLSLLRQAVAALGASAGVLFATNGTSRLEPVVATGVTDGDRGEYERAATAALALGRPHLGDHGGARHAPAHQRGGQVLAIPCFAGDTAAGVLAVRRPPGHRSLESDVDRIGSVLPLALALDRFRMRAVLEEGLAEAEAVRRQLNAYAVDLRSTYLAERHRSEELSRALDELRRTYDATVRGLAIAVEAKDAYTGSHLQRVSRYGMMLTAVVAPEHAGDQQFEYGFLLHDVGKLTVPDAVLAKAGPLDDEEWALMRAHPEAGRTILEGIPFLREAMEIVHAHHEHWDGTGYPRGLTGEEIPLGARIFPLVDAFDTMTTRRPYRPARSMDEARTEIRAASGTQFWPEAVDAFMSIPTEEIARVVPVGGAG